MLLSVIVPSLLLINPSYYEKAHISDGSSSCFSSGL
jgi:hypothetical protein